MTMRQLGVVGLPRNYELFYEAITAGGREMTGALSALGSRPSQKQLDEVARRFLTREDDSAVDEAHQKITSKLDEILALLKRERRSIETYGKILDETSTGLAGRQALSREFLEKIVSVTATATNSSIEARGHTAQSIAEKSGELQKVRSQLEEYKRLADTDPLTQLNNRRAFDRVLSAIYDSSRGIAFGALILIDIDLFKSVNDRFGHPVGDRILQIVAKITSTKAGEGIFVARTGGEEFALVLEGMGEDADDAQDPKTLDPRDIQEDSNFIHGSSRFACSPVGMLSGAAVDSDLFDLLHHRFFRRPFGALGRGCGFCGGRLGGLALLGDFPPLRPRLRLPAELDDEVVSLYLEGA